MYRVVLLVRIDPDFRRYVDYRCDSFPDLAAITDLQCVEVRGVYDYQHACWID